MSELRSEVIVRVADVGGIVVHHCLIFFHNDKCKYIIHVYNQCCRADDSILTDFCEQVYS
jgi:hypothetical protein